jgi:hypothetical protein
MTKEFQGALLAGAMLMGAAAIAQDGPANAGGAPPVSAPSAGARIEMRKDAAPRVEVRKDETEAYFAALEKCGALKVAPEKQRCVDDARRQHGRM